MDHALENQYQLNRARKERTMQERDDAAERAVVSFRKGTVLFKEGDRSCDLYIVKDGKLRVYKTEAGIEIELDTVGAGEVVGEVAAIDGGVRSATVQALENTETIVIPGAEMKKIITEMPDWFEKIAKILVQRLREVDEKIEILSEGDRIHHVASLLTMIANAHLKMTSSPDMVLSMKFVENEITDLLGIPYGEVADILDRLAGREIIELKKNTIRVLDTKTLHRLGTQTFQTTTVERPAI
jgi:CRP-like cAMP-binding protein